MPNGGGPSWAQEQRDLDGYLQLVRALGDHPKSQKAIALVVRWWYRMADWPERKELDDIRERVLTIKTAGGIVPDVLTQALSDARGRLVSLNERFYAVVLSAIIDGEVELNPCRYDWPDHSEGRRDAQTTANTLAKKARQLTNGEKNGN